MSKFSCMWTQLILMEEKLVTEWFLLFYVYLKNGFFKKFSFSKSIFPFLWFLFSPLEDFQVEESEETCFPVVHAAESATEDKKGAMGFWRGKNLSWTILDFGCWSCFGAGHPWLCLSSAPTTRWKRKHLTDCCVISDSKDLIATLARTRLYETNRMLEQEEI